MPLIEIRNLCAGVECKLVKFGQGVGDFVLMSVHLANPVHWTHLRHFLALSISFSVIPFVRAQDSTAASPCSATALLITQHGKACVGTDHSSSDATNARIRVICRASLWRRATP